MIIDSNLALNTYVFSTDKFQKELAPPFGLDVHDSSWSHEDLWGIFVSMWRSPDIVQEVFLQAGYPKDLLAAVFPVFQEDIHNAMGLGSEIVQ